jgi:hypothetical protein
VLGSFAASYHGLALIALCQREHWLAVMAQRSRRKPDSVFQVRMKRWGVVLLSLGCALSWSALGPSFGGLLWVWSLGASAVALTFTLTWRPHWLKFLVPSQRLAWLSLASQLDILVVTDDLE